MLQITKFYEDSDSDFDIEPCVNHMCRSVGSGGGLGGLSPNILLKFVDFVSERCCNSQGYRNEDSNSYIFQEAFRICQKCNIFRCHRSLKSQNFHGQNPICRDPLLPSMAYFPKMGRFPTIKRAWS